MRRFVIFGAAIAVVIALWSAGWLYVSSEIRNQVGLLAEGDGQSEPKLTCARLDVGGYPFRFNVTCAEATLVSGDITVVLPQVELAALVFQPTLFHMRATGPATIEDAFLGGRCRIDWTNLEGSLRVADWNRIGRLSLVADEAAWSDTLLTETLLGKATRAEFHLVDMPAKHDATTGRATLEGYVLLDGAAVPAWTVADGDLAATVEISNLPDNLLALPADPVREWQAAGGRIAVSEIKGTEGEDTITVTGDLGLSDQGLAEGSIEIASKGIAERSAAFLPPEMLPLIFGNAGDDGLNHQRLMIANGVLFLGMLPAFAFAPFF
jgi:hypothetical protein